jgi:hypothetical protein
MPRGNPQNLKVPTSEEAQRNGKAGGIASGKARREKKDMMQTMKALLDMMQMEDGVEMSGREIVCIRQIQKASEGDTRAAEYCRDTAGEKAPDKIDANINSDIVVDFGNIDDDNN